MRRLLAERELTINTGAERMGVSQPFLSQVINGRRRAPTETAWVEQVSGGLALTVEERKLLTLLVQMTHDPRWGSDGRTTADLGLATPHAKPEIRAKVNEPSPAYDASDWRDLARQLQATQATIGDLLGALERSLVPPSN